MRFLGGLPKLVRRRIAMHGRYARLYEQQQRAARNRFVNPGEELTASG